jgi:hypothetical protein
MSFRQTETATAAAAKAGLSAAAAYRIEQHPRLLRKEITARAPGQDPLGYGWDREIVPLLKSNSGLRSAAIFEGIRRRHPEDRRRRPRTLERRIRAWR